VSWATEWQINADEPDLLDYDKTFKSPEQDALFEENPFRSSDHDPMIVGLDLLRRGHRRRPDLEEGFRRRRWCIIRLDDRRRT
jgi:predicted extracellular nuclease